MEKTESQRQNPCKNKGTETREGHKGDGKLEARRMGGQPGDRRTIKENKRKPLHLKP